MVNPLDLVAQNNGDGPETVVMLPNGSLLGFHIKGTDLGRMLGIREDELGRVVSCAITNELHVNHPAQSNPQRLKHGYGHVEDDGA